MIFHLAMFKHGPVMLIKTGKGGIVINSTFGCTGPVKGMVLMPCALSTVDDSGRKHCLSHTRILQEQT